MRIAVCVSLVLWAVCGSSVALGEDPVSFNREIRPILSETCFLCHGPDANRREADLRLDKEAAAKDYAIVAGRPDDSELFARIVSNNPDEQMPPPDSGKSLTAENIETLRRWIEQGAPYEDHWAFIPPRRPAAANVRDTTWTRHPLDGFVLARLEAENLKPAPEADRYTLIRRVTLDLTGLPPTVNEVEAFLRDPSDDAYKKVVDRLLRSDRYGEHMAHSWLDAARYADTNGYQYDLEREQWVWRDWVIHAFNTNLPFDQFTVQQIAGDLLPEATDQQKLATAFQRNHPITIEGGVIDEEYRTEYVIDRVVTTSTVWLGLTMMCGRCHDHKYDPLSQREFYQLFAFFNNVPERGLNGFDPRLKVNSPLRIGEVARVQRQLEAAQQRLKELLGAEVEEVAAWKQQLAEQVRNRWTIAVPTIRTSNGGAELTVLPDQSILASGKNPAEEVYELVLDADRPIHAIRVEALTHESFVGGGTGRGSNANFVLSEFQVAAASTAASADFSPVKVATAEADYSQANYPITAAIDGKIDRTGWAVDGNTKRENRTAMFFLDEPIKPDATDKVRLQLFFAYGGGHHIGRFRIALASRPRDNVPPDVAAIVAESPANRSSEAQTRLHAFLAKRFGSPELRAAADRLSHLRAQLSEAQGLPATMVLAEMETPRNTHVLHRGEYDKPRDQVQAGTPDALPPMPDDFPRNRLGLARWLVMPGHPLTARVAVNRFWQQFLA